MAHAPIEARNYVISCYLVSLIHGETLSSCRVRYKTLYNYISAVLHMHKQRGLPNPSSIDGDTIKPMLEAVRSYESIPNRCEMITDHMISHMLRACSSLPPDSRNAAIVDWIILGRYTGFRQSEWCQTSQTVAMTTPTFFHTQPEPLAFIRSDFEFFDRSGRLLHSPTTSDLPAVDMVRLRWRFQKNNDNGQRIPYKRDYAHPTACPVLAALRIYVRATRLGVSDDMPLAVFSTPKSPFGRLFITAAHVTSLLRATAQTVFGLKPNDPLLHRWSTHSIRVTAANLLHRALRSDSYIQTRLRWKSTSFLMYLRNTFYAGAQHTAALNISNRNLPRLYSRSGQPIPSHRPLEPHEHFTTAPAA